MSIIALIISGLVTGELAKLLMLGRGPVGFIIILLLGIAGILLGRCILALDFVAARS